QPGGWSRSPSEADGAPRGDEMLFRQHSKGRRPQTTDGLRSERSYDGLRLVDVRASGTASALLVCALPAPATARADSTYSMYVRAGTRRIASPITSSARSSSFLNRTHDLPMSSFLPALAHASSNQDRSVSWP